MTEQTQPTDTGLDDGVPGDDPAIPASAGGETDPTPTTATTETAAPGEGGPEGQPEVAAATPTEDRGLHGQGETQEAGLARGPGPSDTADDGTVADAREEGGPPGHDPLTVHGEGGTESVGEPRGPGPDDGSGDGSGGGPVLTRTDEAAPAGETTADGGQASGGA